MRLIRWNVPPGIFLASFSVVLVLVLASGKISKIFNRDLERKNNDLSKFYYREYLKKDLTYAVGLVVRDSKDSTFNYNYIGEKFIDDVMIKNGAKFHRDLSERDQQMVKRLRGNNYLSDSSLDGTILKPDLEEQLLSANDSAETEEAISTYFIYLLHLKERENNKIVHGNDVGFSTALAIALGILTLGSFALFKLAKNHYLTANPPRDHSQSETLIEFLTTVFPIITFKTTRWNALNFLKSQFRRRVTIVICLFLIAVSLLIVNHTYHAYRKASLIVNNQKGEHRSFEYLVEKEEDFNLSLLLIAMSVALMGALFIVPKHLSRKDTDKDIAPAPVG